MPGTTQDTRSADGSDGDPAETVRSCTHCGEPIPEGRERYCTRKCARRAWVASKPPHPFHDWQRASERKSRLKVPPDAEHQAAARLMVERGYCAYENAAGLLCDIGAPRDQENAGRIWTRRP